MKTKLPDAISTIQEAKNFIQSLHKNREMFHPEDDTHTVEWHLPEKQKPTPAECNKLNKLMQDIYNLEGNDGRHVEPMVFDPCSYSLLIDKLFFWKDKTGRGFSNKLRGDHIYDNWDLTDTDYDGKTVLEFIEGADEGEEWETRSQILTRIE